VASFLKLSQVVKNQLQTNFNFEKISIWSLTRQEHQFLLKICEILLEIKPSNQQIKNKFIRLKNIRLLLGSILTISQVRVH